MEQKAPSYASGSSKNRPAEPADRLIPVQLPLIERVRSPGPSGGFQHYSSEDTYKIRLISGTANTNLGKAVAAELGIPLDPVNIGRFADGEINIQVENNIRGSDVYILQSTSPPFVNDAIMELLLLIQTLKLSSAKRITAVIPYYGYARQDRKTKARVPISAAAVAQLIETMGPDRVVTLDLHCAQIQGFFRSIPVDNLFAENEFIEAVRDLRLDPADLAIVSPDAGGVPRARRVADKLMVHNVITILKRRVEANQVESMQIVGDVSKKIAFIVDDIIDTAGTICKAADLLIESGAVKVYGIASHGVFSGNAMSKLMSSKICEIWVTDSIPQEKNVSQCAKLRIIPIGPLVAECIWRLHEEKSLSKLFQDSHSVRHRELLGSSSVRHTFSPTMPH